MAVIELKLFRPAEYQGNHEELWRGELRDEQLTQGQTTQIALSTGTQSSSRPLVLGIRRNTGSSAGLGTSLFTVTIRKRLQPHESAS